MQRRVVLVAGGASGIGLAVAGHFVRQPGHCVVVTSRDQARLDMAVVKLNETAAPTTTADGAADGAGADQQSLPLATGVLSPLASEADCNALATAAAKAHGRVDVVVHAAGITLNKLSARTSADDFATTFHVNCVVPCLLAKAVLRHGQMPRAVSAAGAPPPGCFVGVGSVVGQDGNGGQAAYAASKAALVGAFKSLSKEYGAKGVRFNVVAPGLVDTAMADGANRDVWSQRSALRRIGQPHEVASAVALAVECGYLNGQVLTVDGGRA